MHQSVVPLAQVKQTFDNSFTLCLITKIVDAKQRQFLMVTGLGLVAFVEKLACDCLC